MAGLVAEYLSLVPHDRKFVSISTGDLITNSIKWRPEFSLAKAANAFRAVEQYAANLINQPWRQEFWKIRQYSGFYKHSVETALSGADKLFQEMGYGATSNQVTLIRQRSRVWTFDLGFGVAFSSGWTAPGQHRCSHLRCS